MPRMIGLSDKSIRSFSSTSNHSTKNWMECCKWPDRYCYYWRSTPLELNDLLQVIPFATDELALVLPTNHPLARSKELTKKIYIVLDLSPWIINQRLEKSLINFIFFRFRRTEIT